MYGSSNFICKLQFRWLAGGGVLFRSGVFGFVSARAWLNGSRDGENSGGGRLSGRSANWGGFILGGVARETSSSWNGGRDQGNSHEPAQQEIAG